MLYSGSIDGGGSDLSRSPPHKRAPPRLTVMDARQLSKAKVPLETVQSKLEVALERRGKLLGNETPTTRVRTPGLIASRLANATNGSVFPLSVSEVPQFQSTLQQAFSSQVTLGELVRAHRCIPPVLTRKQMGICCRRFQRFLDRKSRSLSQRSLRDRKNANDRRNTKQAQNSRLFDLSSWSSSFCP